MLNIQFIYFNYFFPMFLLFLSSIVLLCLNYLFYLKNFIFFKLKDKIKIVTHNEVTPVDSSVLDVFTLIVILMSLSFYNNIEYFPHTGSISLTRFSVCVFVFSAILTFALNYFCKNYLNPVYTTNYNSYIGVISSSILFFVTSTQDFVLLFLFIEVFGYLFYFQFLQTYNSLHSKRGAESYIDSLLLYYWVNFFGSIIIIYSISLLFFRFSSTNFIELILFSNYTTTSLPLYLFLLGFSIKMGVPGFHFLKAEVYKNLKLDAIINFSFFSACGYLSMLSYITSYFLFVFNFNFILLFIFILILVFVVPTNLRIVNIILFFGYSAILNIAICIFLFF